MTEKNLSDLYSDGHIIVLNSFSDKAKLSRGSKIMNLIKNFKNSKDTYKTTLSGCIFKKVSNTMIISREI